MNQPIIEVNNLGKFYTIGHEQKASAGTLTMRDALTNIVRKPKEIIFGHKLNKEKFWALKDVNFEIEKGDVVGLIGRNGSGKSTMLKIFSRITEPSTGSITMRGRTASLLEVGTGFHPELTGKENIFFNGAILGMKRKEIESKFDEIVAFSGVEKFLDTPVKFYSSGMYVRLAFAVAAHLEPDILMVDEVLAVGDAEFQRKSLGKMQDVTKKHGRTVIFVSHNMEAINSICNKCIWLNSGKVMAIGKTEEVVKKYTEFTSVQSVPLKKRKDRQGTGKVQFTNISIDDSKVGSDKELLLTYSLNNKTKETFNEAKISTDIFDQFGNYVSNLTNFVADQKISIKPGKSEIQLKIKNINLVPGNYSFNLFLASDKYNSEILDWIENAHSFNMPNYDFYKTGTFPSVKGKIIYLNFEYEQD